MLSEQAIAEYKELYQKRFGITLDDKEAIEKATSLMRLYKAVYINPKNMKMRKNYEEKAKKI